MLYSTLDLVYSLSGRILVPPRCILNFICVRVAWQELFSFEIRADRCILVAIFGAGFLGFYVAWHRIIGRESYCVYFLLRAKFRRVWSSSFQIINVFPENPLEASGCVATSI